MKLTIPPHIAWPLFVVVLIGMSVTAVVITVIAAHSDGGPQVIENYYEKAVRWDESTARQTASDALGWQVALTVAPAKPGTDRRLDILIQDREGAPVTHLHGTVRAFRPHRAEVVFEHPLLPVQQAPGHYHLSGPIRQAGLWDFEIVARREAQTFITTVRKDIQH